MSKTDRYNLLLSYIRDNHINKYIIIQEEDILFLKIFWNNNNINGESFIFLSSDIEKYDENIFFNKIKHHLLDIKCNYIDNFIFKKINQFTFLYYTII